MDVYFGIYFKNTKIHNNNFFEWISNKKFFSNNNYIENNNFIGVLLTQSNNSIHEDSQYITLADKSSRLTNNFKNYTTDNSTHYKVISDILENKSFEKLNEFQGNFSFITYDKTNNEIILCRDHLGWSNLCYYETSDALYMSNDIELLAKCPDCLFKLDKSYINQVLQKKTFHNHLDTPFQNLEYFPPSNIGQFKTKLSLKNYWNFYKKSNFNYTNETVCLDQFEKALIEPFKHKNKKNSLMLSGGCDSSLIAALLTKHDIPFKAYSYYFNHFKNCNESFYIDQTVKKLNLNHEYIVVDNSLPFDKIDNNIQRFETINLNPYQLLDNCLIDAMKKDGTETVITGHFGDDMFFGSQSLLFELLHSKNLFYYIKSSKLDFDSILSSLKHLPHYKHFVKYCISRISPNFLIEKHKRSLYLEFKNIISNKTYTDLEISLNIPYGTRRHIFHMLNIRQVHAVLSDIQKQFHINNSFEVHFPYLTPKMIEFIWQTPPQMLDRSPKTNRYLQRKSLERNGLEFIASRSDKTSFFPVLDAGVKRNYEKLISLYENSQLRKNGYLDDISFDMTNAIDANKFSSVERWYQQFSSRDIN